MKTFTYKDYENCYFRVGSYAADNKAMAISIENLEDGPIATCTVYDIYSAYSEHITTIKNYSENSHMTKFLKKIKVVDEVLFSRPCNSFVADTLYTNNPQTIDTCLINTDILKEYSKVWKIQCLVNLRQKTRLL